ncbi:CTD kinase subunit beta [Monosporozyma servazzii]
MASSAFESELCLSRPYLTKNQIIYTQKKTINDRRTYNQKKLSILNFLSDLCVKLELPRKTLETSMYFYQRYHLFNNFETELCYSLATSCLVLSCKQVETFKKVNEIATLSLQIRNMAKINTDTLESFKKVLYQIELRILEACNFDYRINNNAHVDEYIIKIGKTLSLDYNVCELAWLIAYDVLKLDVILMVPPPIIAFATLKLANELFDNSSLSSRSYDMLGSEEAMVDDVFFHIVNFYINAFDLCDLKYHIPSSMAPISIERFMVLKSKTGPEVSMPDLTEGDFGYDDYLKKTRNFTVQERRYVLSSDVIKEECDLLKRI